MAFRGKFLCIVFNLLGLRVVPFSRQGCKKLQQFVKKVSKNVGFSLWQRFMPSYVLLPLLDIVNCRSWRDTNMEETENKKKRSHTTQIFLINLFNKKSSYSSSSFLQDALPVEAMALSGLAAKLLNCPEWEFGKKSCEGWLSGPWPSFVLQISYIPNWGY